MDIFTNVKGENSFHAERCKTSLLCPDSTEYFKFRWLYSNFCIWSFPLHTLGSMTPILTSAQEFLLKFSDDDRDSITHSMSRSFYILNCTPNDPHNFRGGADFQFLILLHFENYWEYNAMIKYDKFQVMFSLLERFTCRGINWPRLW